MIDAFLPSDDLASRYAQNPADVSGVVLPSALVGVKDAAIIFHGAGGPDRETRAMEARFAEQDAAAGLARGVATFNWLPWFTTDTQRTSFQSKDVGRALGLDPQRMNRLTASLAWWDDPDVWPERLREYIIGRRERAVENRDLRASRHNLRASNRDLLAARHNLRALHRNLRASPCVSLAGRRAGRDLAAGPARRRRP